MTSCRNVRLCVRKSHLRKQSADFDYIVCQEITLAVLFWSPFWSFRFNITTLHEVVVQCLLIKFNIEGLKPIFVFWDSFGLHRPNVLTTSHKNIVKFIDYILYQVYTVKLTFWFHCDLRQPNIITNLHDGRVKFYWSHLVPAYHSNICVISI